MPDLGHESGRIGIGHWQALVNRKSLVKLASFGGLNTLQRIHDHAGLWVHACPLVASLDHAFNWPAWVSSEACHPVGTIDQLFYHCHAGITGEGDKTMRKLSLCLTTLLLAPIIAMADAPTPPCNPCDASRLSCNRCVTARAPKETYPTTMSTIFWIVLLLSIG